MEGVIKDAKNALSSLRHPKERVLGVMDGLEPTIEGIKNAYELWEPILEKVQIFASVVEGIGDVRHSVSRDARYGNVERYFPDSPICEDSDHCSSLSRQGTPLWIVVVASALKRHT